MVRSKFHLENAIANTWGGMKLVFRTQYDNTIPEDQRFQKATPSGVIEMTVDNQAALDQLKIGASYYVDFSPVSVTE